MTTTLEWLDRTGADLAQWLVWMSVWAAALLVVVLLLDGILAKRVSAAWRIALYGVIAVRLALPLGWASPVGVVRGAGAGVDVTQSGAQQSVPYLSDIPIVGQMFRGEPPLPPRQVDPGPGLTWRVFVLPIYALGVTIFAGVLALRLRGARRIARESRPLEPGHAALADSPGVRVRVHPTAGPVLLGVLSPTLVVPEALAHDDAAGDLSAVLAHERAHVHRADHVLASVLALATVVLWPLAAVWLAAARVRALMEQAADELAVRGADAPGRAAYGESLVRIARDARRAAALARLAPSPALGFADSLESRVRALANTRRWGGVCQGGVIVAACAVLIACAGSRAAAHADEPEAPAALRESQTKATADVPRTLYITVLPGVPNHPLIAPLQMNQQEHVEAVVPETRDAALNARPREVKTWSAEEAQQVIRAAGEQAFPPMVSPVIRVAPGVEGVVTIGEIVDRPGEGRADPVTLKNGIVVRAHVSKASSGVPANSAGVTIEFTEFKDGQEYTWTWHGPVVVPHGRTAWTYATGEKGAPVRMILVSAEPAPDDADVNPMDPAAFPYVSTMIWMMELKEPMSFEQLLPGALKGECSGTASFAASTGVTTVTVSGKPSAVAGAWASMVPQARLDELGDNLYKLGARHVASPVLFGKPRKPMTLAPGSLDKARSSTGPYGITLSSGVLKGDASSLEGVQTVALTDGSSRRMCSFEGVRVEPGDALAILQPPVVAGGPWLITVYNPEYIASQEKYPFQRAGQFEMPPEVKDLVEKQVKKQTAAPPPPRP